MFNTDSNPPQERRKTILYPKRAASGNDAGNRVERESAEQQLDSHQLPAPSSTRAPTQKEQKVLGSGTMEPGSQAGRKPPAAAREPRSHRHRTIPSPPHRQLFLVDTHYGDEHPLYADIGEGHPTPQWVTGGATGSFDSTNRGRRDTPGPNRFDGIVSSTWMPMQLSPSAPPGTQLFRNASGINVTQAGSRTGPPTLQSPAATSGVPDCRNRTSRKSRRLTRRRFKQRIYEPVELQVESISALAMRLTIFLWYACLVAALVVEVIPSLQWSMTNICGASFNVDLRSMDRWRSPCVVSEPLGGAGDALTTSEMVSIRWSGAMFTDQSRRMVRYRRLVLSLPPPPDQARDVQVYDIVAETRLSGNGAELFSEYPVSMRCDRRKSRCDVVRVPEFLLGYRPNVASEVSFTLTSVPASLAIGAVNGSLGLAYQRSTYTIATVWWRYVLMFLSLLHTLRFVVYRRYTSSLYEQSWTIILQMGLLWYLDPLFILSITNWSVSSVLAFLEYRIPTYFMAVMIAYMLSVMTASMAWSRSPGAKPGDGVFAKLKNFLMKSHSVYDPPLWTKLLISAYMISIFLLDLVDAFLDQNMWYSPSNSEAKSTRVHWVVTALHILGGFICLILLFYLREYLGTKPYLESRPQQLACRVFLMVFLSAIGYYIVHFLVFLLLYNREYPALASQQPFLQLPMLMVASFLVNIMTLVYTSQNRDENVPINPKDPRWKHMVWPDSWYRWLARHGGSQYIFATEREETRFYRLQLDFRWRQFMAKQKRRHGAGGRRGVFSPSHAGATVSATPRESGGDADVPCGTDMRELPQPSDVASAPNTNNEDGGASEWGGEPTDKRAQSCRSATRARLDDWLGFQAARSARCLSRDANLSHHVGRYSEGTSGGSAPLSRLDAQGGRLRGGRINGDPNDSMRLTSAARRIMNMDSFSTFFLADDNDMATRDWGCGSVADEDCPLGRQGGIQNSSRMFRFPKSYSSFARDVSPSVDTHAIEGPARRMHRLQHSFSALRSGLSVVGNSNVDRISTFPKLPAATAPSHAHGHTERDGDHTIRSPLSSGGSSPTRHRAGSCPDGDVFDAQPNNGGKRLAMHSGGGFTGHGARPLPRRSSYRDPTSGVFVSEDTGQIARDDSRPLDKESAPRASTSVSPTVVVVRSGEDADEEQRLSESEVTMNTLSSSFAQQRPRLLSAMLQIRAPNADVAVARDGGNPKEAPLNDNPKSLTLPCYPPLLPTGLASGAPAVDSDEVAVRRRHVEGMKGNQSLMWRSQQNDAFSDLSSDTSSDSDDDNRSSHTHGGARSLMRTLNMARVRLGALMESAERHLLVRPVRRLERLEAHIIDAAYRPFQTIHYLPFFNLETVIDCFNISWQAYGVGESTSDPSFAMGLQVRSQNIPQTVAHSFRKILCVCCEKEDTTGDDTSDNGYEGEIGQEETGMQGLKGGAARGTQGTAAVASATGDDSARHEVHSPTVLHSHSPSRVVVHMRGDGQIRGTGDGADDSFAGASNRTAAPALAHRSSLSHTVSSPTGQGSSVRTPITGPTATFEPSVLPIDVEKYGFVRLLVAEASEVQVLMVKIDTNATEHKGKAPRVIVGFRGTANMSNAKHDVNFHRVVWREMERAAHSENANASGDAASERASTCGGSSAASAQYLGCASCIQACIRKTSWRPTCHAGFLTIWKKLRPTVLSRLRALLHDDSDTIYRIFTTGHSLGGALASLCAFSITCMLKRMDYPIADTTVYTFGQPRMGNRTFQRMYNKAVPRTFRVVNESDFIASMSIFGGYHVGIEVDVDRHGNYIVKPTEIERLFPPTKGRGLMLVNHLMASYGISLNAIASRTSCPARCLDLYLTADPSKIEAERVKTDATEAAPS